MAQPALDEVNTLTVKRILPGIVDDFFKNSPTLAYMKKNRYKVWTGGPEIQSNFIYKPKKGGSYKPGAKFDITTRQEKTGIRFDPRYYYTNDTQTMEDIEVIFRGPEA